MARAKYWCKDWFRDRIGDDVVQGLSLLELGVFQKLYWMAAKSWADHSTAQGEPIEDGRVSTGTKYYTWDKMVRGMQNRYPNEDAKQIAAAFSKLRDAGHIKRNKNGHFVHALFARCHDPMTDAERKAYSRRLQRRRDDMGPPPDEEGPAGSAPQPTKPKPPPENGPAQSCANLRDSAPNLLTGTGGKIITVDFTTGSVSPEVSRRVTQRREVELELDKFSKEPDVERRYARAREDAPPDPSATGAPVTQPGASPNSLDVNPPAAPPASAASGPSPGDASTVYGADTEREQEREREQTAQARSAHPDADTAAASRRPGREPEQEREQSHQAASQAHCLRSTASPGLGPDAADAGGAAGGGSGATRSGTIADGSAEAPPGSIPKDPLEGVDTITEIYDMDPIEAAVLLTGEGEANHRALWRKHYRELTHGLYWQAIAELQEAQELGKVDPAFGPGRLLNSIMGRFAKAVRPSSRGKRGGSRGKGRRK